MLTLALRETYSTQKKMYMYKVPHSWKAAVLFNYFCYDNVKYLGIDNLI